MDSPLTHDGGIEIEVVDNQVIIIIPSQGLTKSQKEMLSGVIAEDVKHITGYESFVIFSKRD